MFLKSIPSFVSCVMMGALLIACESSTTGDAGPSIDTGVPPGPPPPPPPPGPPPPPPAGYPESGKANLRFKKNERIANDFAVALGFTRNNVCLEFGLYSCTDLVHRVSLGGVEPYTLNLNEPLPSTTITTPLAVERVALYACEKRVTEDFQVGNAALIFRNLPVAADGTLEDVERAEVATSIDALYKNALQRPPTEAELGHLKDFYTEVASSGEPNAAKEWAVLSCFSVLTSTESLFY